MKLKDITEEDIRGIADSTKILARGIDYYETDQVKSIEVKDDAIYAKVHGSYGVYDVTISIENGKIDADCDCPYDGYGCKHIVAVLYKWIDNKGKKLSKKPREKKEIDLKKEISKLDKDELLNIVLMLCQNYDDVRKDIILRVSSKVDTSEELKDIICSQIDDALYTRDGFIDYYAVFDVVRKLDKIKDSILQSAPNIRTMLLKHILRKTIPVHNEGCDDSGGSMGQFVLECLHELGKSIHEQTLSFEEKRKAIIENFNLIEKDQYGLDDGYINLILEIPSTKRDFDFLIKELKERIEKEKEDYEREKYENMLTEIYKRAGKDKEYLAILEENAKKEGDYLPLAQFWKEKRDIKKAIEVAEEGIKVEKDYGHGGLFEFLEEIYSKQKNKEDLLRILKLDFKETPSLSKYKEIVKLCKYPNKCKEIRKELIKRSDNYTLIEIYLFEKKPEEAYNILMNSKIRSDRIKDEVAKALMDEHPEKSLKIYSSIVKQFIDMAKRDSYRIAALYAKRVQEIYLNLNKNKGWNKYIALVRENNKRRPALIEEFRRL